MVGTASPKDESTKNNRRNSPRRATGDDAPSPPAKRQRVYVACEHCRLRKQKCDSKRPACSTCIATGQQCVYGAGVKKRGLPPGYVRVLETLLGLIFTKIPNSEEAVTALLLNSGVVTRQWALGKSDDGNDAVLQRFKKSHVCKSIERLLEGEARDSSDPFPPSSAMSGDMLEQQDWKGDYSTSSDNLLRSRQATSLVMHSGSPTNARSGPVRSPDTDEAQTTNLFRLPLELRASLYVELLSESPAWLRAGAINESAVSLRLPSNTWTLLDIYFTWTNCWLPIVHRQEILKTFHSYESQTIKLDLDSTDAEKHAVLWAILAHASYQEHASASKGVNELGSTLSCSQLYQTARSLVPLDFASYERGHVQALILLSLINSGRGQNTVARELIGQAIRIGDQIGLGKESLVRVQSNRSTVPLLQDESIMMGCFVVDTLLSVWVNKPSQFKDQALGGVGSIDTDRLDEYEPWFDRTKLQGSSSSDSRRGPQYSFTVFNQLTKVVNLLHRHHERVDQSGPILPEIATDTFNGLRIWASALPSMCQLQTPLSRAQKLHVTPQLLNLHIIHQFINIHCMEGSNANLESAIRSLPIETDSKLSSLLLIFDEIFGCIAMPSTFSQITKSAGHWEGLLQPSSCRTRDLSVRVHQTWRVQENILPALPQHVRDEIERASNETAYFLSANHGVLEKSQEHNAPVQHVTTPSAQQFNSSTPLTHFVASESHDDFISIPQSLPYQRASLSQQSVASDAHPISHVHMTIAEDILYPISPMSIDNTFKRPEQPASASSRSLHTAFVNPQDPYQQRITNFGHVAEGYATHNHAPQQRGFHEPQFLTPYNSNSRVMNSSSFLSSNYDLDQLFNDLAPPDQGDR